MNKLYKDLSVLSNNEFTTGIAFNIISVSWSRLKLPLIFFSFEEDDESLRQAAADNLSIAGVKHVLGYKTSLLRR